MTTQSNTPENASGASCSMVASGAEERLREFALGVMECWPGGDLDGGTLQELAVKHGLLAPETHFKPCRTEDDGGCRCAEYWTHEEWADGQQCYRFTALLRPSAGAAVQEAGEAARQDQPEPRQQEQAPNADAREPLSDERIAELAISCAGQSGFDLNRLCRAVEREHGIGSTEANKGEQS
jgi:hypothetical protein